MTVTATEAADQPEQVQATPNATAAADLQSQNQPADTTAAADSQGQTAQQAEQGAMNALQANIEEKRERSYYYAHRPRDTSEEPAPPPVHVVLERTVAEAAPTVVTIFNYAWLDEGEVVKVYIPLEGVGTKCRDEDIKTTFEERVLQVDVEGYKAGQVQRLLIPKLSAAVLPDQCRVRKLANKVVVSLRKADNHKWYNLKST